VFRELAERLANSTGVRNIFYERTAPPWDKAAMLTKGAKPRRE